MLQSETPTVAGDILDLAYSKGGLTNEELDEVLALISRSQSKDGKPPELLTYIQSATLRRETLKRIPNSRHPDFLRFRERFYTVTRCSVRDLLISEECCLEPFGTRSRWMDELEEDLNPRGALREQLALPGDVYFESRLTALIRELRIFAEMRELPRLRDRFERWLTMSTRCHTPHPTAPRRRKFATARS